MDQQQNYSSSMSSQSTNSQASHQYLRSTLIQQTTNAEMFESSSDGWVDYMGNKIDPNKNLQKSDFSSRQSDDTEMKKSAQMQSEAELQCNPALVDKYINRILTCPSEHICALKTQQDIFFYLTCTCLTDFKDQECIEGQCLNECYLKKQSLLSQKQNLDQQQAKSPRKLTKLQQTFLNLNHCECRAQKFKCLNNFYCACKFNGRKCTEQCACDIRICVNLEPKLQHRKKEKLERQKRERQIQQRSKISSESGSSGNFQSNESQSVGFVQMDFLHHAQSIENSEMIDQEKDQVK